MTDEGARPSRPHDEDKDQSEVEQRKMQEDSDEPGDPRAADDADAEQGDAGSDREPHPEERGVDEESKCPECGEPIENVRMTCPNCGHEYKDDEYTDEEAGTDFRAGTAVDEEGQEKDVVGDADVDEEGGSEGGPADDHDADSSEDTSSEE